VARSEDPIGIEFALRNASLDACKEALPALRESDDEPDDRSHEHHMDVHMSNYGSITAIGCGGASGQPNSNPAKYSKQACHEPHAEREGDMTVDLVTMRWIHMKKPCATIQIVVVIISSI
jgi:hypothetical protein